MISFENKCIFVHIPKTGGTSVEDAIWGSNHGKRTVDQLWMGVIRPGYNKYQTGGLQHLLASQIRQEVGAETFDNYFKFTFVRNPWDKVVSQYLYVKKRPMIMKSMGIDRGTPFSKYVESLARDHQVHVQSFEQWQFLLDDHSRSMVDFIGRFENLDSDFQTVAETIGIPGTRLPHKMKNWWRKKYQQYYDERTVQLISEIYAKDIELFGYKFE